MGRKHPTPHHPGHARGNGSRSHGHGRERGEKQEVEESHRLLERADAFRQEEQEGDILQARGDGRRVRGVSPNLSTTRVPAASGIATPGTASPTCRHLQ